MLKIIWVVTFLAFASPLSAVSTLSVPDKFNETGNATEDTSEDSDSVMHVHLANVTELVNSTSMAQTPIMIIGSFFRDLFLKLSFNMSFSPVFSFSPVITLNGPVSVSMSQIPPAPSNKPTPVLPNTSTPATGELVPRNQPALAGSKLVPELITIWVHHDLEDAKAYLKLTITLDKDGEKLISAPLLFDNRDMSQVYRTVVFSTTVFPEQETLPEISRNFQLRKVLSGSNIKQLLSHKQSSESYLSTISLTGSGAHRTPFSAKCYYWKSTESLDDVELFDASNGTSSCWSGPSTAYSVMGRDKMDEVAFTAIVAGSSLGLSCTHCIHGMTAPSRPEKQFVICDFLRASADDC